MSTDPKALLRTEMIVKVRSGLMTAKAAAEALGVSRKTYSAGRPSKVEAAEVRALRRKVKTLSAKLEEMAQTAELRLMLRLLERRDAKKKPKES